MTQEPEVVPLRFVQYQNDALSVAYSDGSMLQLSPCGNQFLHELAPGTDIQPSSGLSRVLQKSEFATSAFRAKVREALEFRNLFAERPFVCPLLGENSGNNEDTKLDCDETVQWPDDIERVEVTPSGRLLLQALRPASCLLLLSPNRQEFRAEFAVIPQPSRLPSASSGSGLRPIRITQHHSVRRVEPCWQPGVNLLLRAIGIPGDEEVADEPSDATLPLPTPLPLRCPRQHLHRFGGVGGNITAGGDGLEWLVCGDGQNLVKVLCLDGVLYRMRHVPPHLAVEIFPGDGSLLVSNNLSGLFFTHFWHVDGTVHERVYSAASPPPSGPSTSRLDLPRVLRRARRLCEYLADYLTLMGDAHRPINCCWLPTDGEEELEREFQRVLGSKTSSRSTSTVSGPASERAVTLSDRRTTGSDISSSKNKKQPIIEQQETQEKREPEDEREKNSFSRGAARRVIEKHEVTDVGTFSATASGRIHILFCDRVALDMRADLSRRLAFDNLPQLPPNSCPDLPPLGYVRLFTREGRFEIIRADDPPPYYARYINAACEWTDWVNSNPDERRVFYTTRPDPPSPRAELNKIERFNYILDGGSQRTEREGSARGRLQHCSASTDILNGRSDETGQMTAEDEATQARARQIRSIEETLSRTSEFLRQLDSLRSGRSKIL